MDTNHALCAIYEFDARACRCGDDQAIVVPSEGATMCVVRPWPWNLDDSREGWPTAPLHMSTRVCDFLAADPEKVGSVDLGSLLVWASRRSRRVAHPIDGFDRAGDPQDCAGQPFNRVLIREALQTFVEVGALASIPIDVGILKHGPGWMLRMKYGDTVAMVMSLAPNSSVLGDDPMPVEWSTR
jgi:hypothetical protein